MQMHVFRKVIQFSHGIRNAKDLQIRMENI